MRLLQLKNILPRLALPFLIAGCQVMLVGAYDQVTDQSIQKIQNEVMTLIVKLERNIDHKEPEKNEYTRFAGTYEELAGEIESLKIRCQSIPKYNLVLEQVILLQANLDNLEKYHRIGFKSKDELEPIRKAFESEFGAMIVLQNALKRKKSN